MKRGRRLNRGEKAEKAEAVEKDVILRPFS
jgi:hypothetical protein